MFDTYYKSSWSPVVYESRTTTVTEKRAPTDQSVNLLKEMEAAARQKIVNSIRVDNTEFKCVIHSYENYISGTNKFMVIFKLNGKQTDLEIETSTFKTREETSEIIWQKVSESIAAQIGRELNKSFEHLSFANSQFT
jgi:hypothetical protein